MKDKESKPKVWLLFNNRHTVLDSVEVILPIFETKADLYSYSYDELQHTANIFAESESSSVYTRVIVTGYTPAVAALVAAFVRHKKNLILMHWMPAKDGREEYYAEQRFVHHKIFE